MAKYRPVIILNSALIGFLLIMLLVYPVDVLRDYSITNYPSAYEYNGKALIYGDACAEQVFTASGKADAFDIRIDVANGSFYGSFIIRLFDANNKKVAEWNIDKLDIVDGWIECRMKDQYLIPGNKYQIEIIAPELTKYDAIILMLAPADMGESAVGAMAYVGAGESKQSDFSDHSLSFGVYRYRFNGYALAALIILFTVANICMIFKNRGIEFLAAPILLGMGLVMLVAYPFGYSSDERYHFYSAYEMSNIMLGNENTGLIENKHIIETDLFQNYTFNQSYIMVMDELKKGRPVETGNMDNLAYKNDLNQPFSHLAQALGVTLGRMLDLNVIKIYYLSRIFNLISYVLMILIAVKLVPVNKELMVMLGINPMILRVATSASYDAPVTGLSYIFIALIIKLMNDENKVDWFKTLVCVVLIALMSPIKVVYTLLGFLILAVPKERFRSVPDRVIKSIAIIESGFLSTWLSRRHMIEAVMAASSATAASETVDHPLKYSASFAIEHPLRCFRLILFNAAESLDNSLYDIFGASLGVHKCVALALIVVMVMCAMAEKKIAVRTGFGRFVFLGLALACYLTIFFVFLLAETYYGREVIVGWQSRYFIPFIPLVFYCLCGHSGNLKLDKMSLFAPIWFIEIMFIIGEFQNISLFLEQ